MAGSLAERLQLVVDATTTGAEASFARLGGVAKDTGEAAQRSASQVADAAQKVAQAQAREQDAIKAVEVAMLRLDEVRGKSGATASQIAAAEARVESAQRKAHLAARDATTAIEAQTAANREAVTATHDAGEATERMGGSLKELALKGGALLGGVELGDWARDAFDGFLEGSRGAAAMATGMNATVEQAGAFLTLVGSVGLELDDLTEIQAEFATKSKDGMTQVGTALEKNADGTVNWTTTIVGALSALQKIPDATERNRAGFAMFGEEGYKQLSRLLNTGVNVEDALAAIGTPFSDEDVALTREFDQTMTELKTSSGELGRTLGRSLLPLVLGLVDAGQEVGDVISAVPGPIAATAAVSVLLGVAMRKAGTEGSFLAVQTARASAALAEYRTVAALTSTPLAVLNTAGQGLKTTASGLLGAFGGPLGVAVLGAGAAFYYAAHGASDLKAHAHDMAVELAAAEKANSGAGTSIEQAARQLENSAGLWEGYAATVRGTAITAATELNGFEQGLVGIAQAVGGAGAGAQLAGWLADTDVTTVGFTAAIKSARAELEGLDEQQAVAQITTKGLNDLIAEGDTTSSAFADAVRGSAEAQADASRTQDIATAAVAAYNAITRDAVQTTLDFMGASLSAKDARYGFLDAMDAANAATDDSKTSVDEVAVAHLRLQQAALDSASASADAAVDNAKASGTIMDAATEAKTRADAMIGDLRQSLATPGLTDQAQADIQTMIDKLVAAQEKGDITAVLSLTGAPEAEQQIDQTTEDRTATVTLESRNGPEVSKYLDGIASAERLSLVRVESRNGPAVLEYLQTIADAQRLALIRAESRNGPAVVSYLDGIASTYRLAIINVETRGGPAVERYLDGLAAERTAIINARGAGLPLRGAPAPTALAAAVGGGLRSVDLDLRLVGTLDRSQLSRAEQGRVTVEGIRAYTQRNGAGWLREILP